MVRALCTEARVNFPRLNGKTSHHAGSGWGRRAADARQDGGPNRIRGLLVIDRERGHGRRRRPTKALESSAAAFKRQALTPNMVEETMRGFAYGFVAWIALLCSAEAESINLLCGFETVTIDTDAKSVRVQESFLNRETREYKFREFKDGYKHAFFAAKVQDYVSITEASISYGHDDPQHFNALHYRIDRHTGILVSTSYNPTTCSLLPTQLLF